MSAKEKSKVGAPFPSREKEIERLEKDVEELRHLAGDGDANAELERLRGHVAELRREFYTHLGPWQTEIGRWPPMSISAPTMSRPRL